MSIFAPYRALGYVVDDVPFAVQRRGKETYVALSIGDAWQVYNAQKLTQEILGAHLPRRIAALECADDLTWAGLQGGAIAEFRRAHQTRTLVSHSATPVALLRLGPVLLSLGKDGLLNVWDLPVAAGSQRSTAEVPDGDEDGDEAEDGEDGATPGQPPAAAPEATVSPRLSHALAPDFTPTAMCHPDAYLNKVLIGSREGRLQLWNFATGTMLHEFTCGGEHGFGSPITCLESSPALDVVGVGLEDGRAALVDLRSDALLETFENAAGAGAAASRLLGGSAAAASASARRRASRAVRALAFGDGKAGGGSPTGDARPLMAAGGDEGALVVWDLDAGRLAGVVPEAHSAPITSLHWFRGEPRVMSAGRDNSVRQWACDTAGAPPRPLRQRAGHAAPPTRVRHYGDDGKALLALCGPEDGASIRAHSAIRSERSRAFADAGARAARARRLGVPASDLGPGRPVALAFNPLRERDWDNVVTAHAGNPAAVTWSVRRGARGEHDLGAPTGGAPTALAVSQCGHFAIVGRAGGRVTRHNLQSGAPRGEYALPGGLPAHRGAVVAVASDAVNGRVATAGADGVLRAFDFRTLKPLGSLEMGSPVVLAATDGPGVLVAAACDDAVIRVVDLQTLRLVRTFAGHTDRLTDVQFSPDRRWLLSSSMDGTLRVWDVPGARLLQVLTMGPPITSLSLSPASDVLATTHVNRRGIYLWSNVALGSAEDIVASTKVRRVRLPTAANDPQAAIARGFSDAGSGAALFSARSGKRVEVTIAGRPATIDKDGKGDRTAAAAAVSLPARVAAATTATAAGPLSTWSEDEEAGWWSGDDEDEDGDELGDVGDEEGEALVAEARRQAKAGPEGEGSAPSGPRPLAPSLTTLSALPRSRTHGLVNLAVIRARNKPLEAPKKPKAAPFFLPTVAGAKAGRLPVFDVAAGENGSDATRTGSGDDSDSPAASSSGSDSDSSGASSDSSEGAFALAGRVEADPVESSDEERAGPRARPRSALASADGSAPAAGSDADALLKLLARCRAAGDWTSAVATLRALPPARADIALRGVGGPDGSHLPGLAILLQFLSEAASSGANFDLVHAALAVTLDGHGEAIAASRRLARAAAALRTRVSLGVDRLDASLEAARVLVSYLSDAAGAA